MLDDVGPGDAGRIEAALRRRPEQDAGGEHAAEGVPGADDVGDLDLEARVGVHLARGVQVSTALPLGQGDHLQAVAVHEIRHRPDSCKAGDDLELLVGQLEDRRFPKQRLEQVAGVVAFAQVDVVEAVARPRGEEPAQGAAVRLPALGHGAEVDQLRHRVRDARQVDVVPRGVVDPELRLPADDADVDGAGRLRALDDPGGVDPGRGEELPDLRAQLVAADGADDGGRDAEGA